MHWASAASNQRELPAAIEETTAAISTQLDGPDVDLLLAFVSPHHLFHYGQLVPELRERLTPRVLMGCSGGAVIGGGRELEDQPGLTLTAARLPDVDLDLLHLENAELPPLDGSPRAWVERIGVEPSENPQFVILADPFSCDVDTLVQGLDFAYPTSAKVGGMASGAQAPGGNALFANARTLQRGALILTLRGNVQLDTIVAQGCRPIGQLMHITECDEHMLTGLDEAAPMKTLQSIYEASNERDRELMQSSLFLGLVMDELKDNPGPGDFLIRNVMGMNPENGSIAVGANLRPGQSVQFHVRDRISAAEDLESHLQSYETQTPRGASQGALLFSCLGRGKHLYGKDDHDTQMFVSNMGPVPVGGFFCNGEIGPVGGTTYVHGYTSAFGIFRPRNPT